MIRSAFPKSRMLGSHSSFDDGPSSGFGRRVSMRSCLLRYAPDRFAPRLATSGLSVAVRRGSKAGARPSLLKGSIHGGFWFWIGTHADGSDRQEVIRPGADHHRIHSKPGCGWSALSARDRAFIAYQRNAGLHRAAFWRTHGFPNLVLARAAKAEKRRRRKLEEWKRQELRRTPFALLDDPPEELRPKKTIRLDTPYKLPMRPTRRGY